MNFMAYCWEDLEDSFWLKARSPFNTSEFARRRLEYKAAVDKKREEFVHTTAEQHCRTKEGAAVLTAVQCVSSEVASVNNKIDRVLAGRPSCDEVGTGAAACTCITSPNELTYRYRSPLVSLGRSWARVITYQR